MARDEVSAREKALDFYEIEPALLRVVAVKLDSSKTKPRDYLATLWHRRQVSSSR